MDNPTSGQYAVLGSPIRHSLSPVLYRSAFAHQQVSYTFTAIDVAAETFADFLARLSPEWKGFAVTMPDKIEALRCAHHVSPAARTIGAVNTLWRDESDCWCGDNTDTYGIEGAFAKVHLTKTPSSNGPVVILGGGGTARAVIYAAREYTQELVLVLRNTSKASPLVELAQQLGIRTHVASLNAQTIHSWATSASIIVSTLPRDAADIYAAEIAVCPRFFDVIYSPWPTHVAQICQEKGGCMVVGGLTMLLYQALAQYRILTGLEPPARVMAQALSTATGLPVEAII